jgi:AAA domain-containing protein
MKIAVSGSHRTGKSTLVGDLHHSLPGYSVIDEPYRLLEEEGHPFAQPPSLDDFELQLDRSIQSILSCPSRAILDRCPADFLAYLTVHRDHDAFDPAPWMPRVLAAMEQLDLVIFVPIEDPERIAISRADGPRWRRAVHEELRTILLDDPWHLGVATLEVRGDHRERLNQVLRHLAASGAAL